MTEDLVCFGCMVGFHEECNSPKPTTEAVEGATPDFYMCCCWGNPKVNITSVPGNTVFAEEVRRTPKAAEEVRDQTSTGRKRAVVAMAEWGRGLEGSICEWAYLRNAGGGAVPIIGCNGTILRLVKRTEAVGENESPRHVHHGPDKSTLNNNPENLHSICASCHSRWHALNDPHYPENRPDHGAAFLPRSGESAEHDPETKATPLEVEFNQKFWDLSPSVRKTIPYREMLETLDAGLTVSEGE
jgi:hypothetical protein